ncbi:MULTISPECIES: hypothetical protein [unclassified Streptomyces]|uniref:hypothetical protein n=1 Tax=unclassified Streptomyces TaxID=2593676 RepID=UPI000569F309|nr:MULTISPECIES: hypothetical protein [unclassified Streptomyces]MYX31983.1 hypothetical protein [Streptomyces sp. SID8377]
MSGNGQGAGEADEALSAALADAPPQASAGDEAHRAYAAARADVDLLRTQVRLIGDALAARPAPPAERRPRGRRTALAWCLAAVVAGVAGIGGVVLARDAALGGDSAVGDAKRTLEGVVACASDIAEGTVREVTPTGEPGDLRVVMDVDRRLKPAGGAPRLAFTIHIDDDHDDVAPPPEPGSRVLVMVSVLPGEPVDLYEGAADIASARAWMEKALAASRGLPCESDTA